MDESEPIELWVYDLSHGMAKQFAPVVGFPIEGIWHTSLVLYGCEVFYGQGISMCPPGSSHHGQPQKKLQCGRTYLDKDTFFAYIEGVRQTYTAERYHLLDFNCNSFTNDVLGFLNGQSIPQDIINLPRDILNTPFGASLRPMIDQMFSGREGPEAQAAVNSFMPSGSLPDSSQLEREQQSVASNLQICTAPASFQSTLSSNDGVAAMFTSTTCGPCHAIRPTFEGLAKQYPRIQFVLVEVNVGAGNLVASLPEVGGVRGTPTFLFFARGKKFGQCVGANAGELRTQVGMLDLELNPRHPHLKLHLPRIVKLTQSLAPVTYTSVPPLEALKKKLDSFLADASMTDPKLTASTRAALSGDVIAYLGKPPSEPSPTLIEEWKAATNNALDVLPTTEWFPVLDLWRIAIGKDEKRIGVVFVSLLADLVPRLVAAITATSPAPPKALLLTTLRLFSNCLMSPLLVSNLLSPTHVDSLTRIVVRCLLDADQGVRSHAAGLAWSIVGRIYQSRAQGDELVSEDFQVEYASAVVEALKTESESVEVVHRLVATVSMLLYSSPHAEAIASLLQVVEAPAILDEKRTLAASKSDVVALIDELKLVISSSC